MALEEYIETVGRAPIPPVAGLRAVLAYLSTVSASDWSAMVDLWRVVRNPFADEANPGRVRTAAAQRHLAYIWTSLGWTGQFEPKELIAPEKVERLLAAGTPLFGSGSFERRLIRPPRSAEVRRRYAWGLDGDAQARGYIARLMDDVRQERDEARRRERDAKECKLSGWNRSLAGSSRMQPF